MQSCESENKTKLNMPAGVKTVYDDENENRFQRRHFRNSTSSDIFFCGSSSDNIVTSENSSDPDNSCMPLGNDTNNVDQRESEKRHFHVPSENFVTPENNEDEDSSNVQEENEIDEKESEKEEHFQVLSENFVTPAKNEDQNEQVDSVEIMKSTEIETGDADQKKTQRRHFHDKTSSNIFFSD